MRIIRFFLIGVLGAGIASGSVHSGDTLDVHSGTTPTIDGILAPGEWNDALPIALLKDPSLPAAPDTGAVVFIKHDNNRLYLGFRDTPGIWTIHGVFIDRRNDGGLAPAVDDCWLAYDADQHDRRESSGDGSFWSDAGPPSGWDCAGGTDQLEYAIDLSKCGIHPGEPKLLGFHVGKGGAAPWEYVWPRRGTQDACFDRPESWGDIGSSDNWSGIAEPPSPGVRIDPPARLTILPNPFRGRTELQVTLADDAALSLTVFDAAGNALNTLARGLTRQGQTTIAWDGTDRLHRPLPAGVYFCRLRTGRFELNRKIVRLGR